MTTYYECHITMEDGDRPAIERVVKNKGWRFSTIDGDINLGKGVKVYATMQLNSKFSESYVVKFLNEIADQIAASGVKVLRRKVERVIFDDRSSKVGACEDNCAVCQTEENAHAAP